MCLPPFIFPFTTHDNTSHRHKQMSSTRDIDALIELMAKLPGLGPRSARRAVLHLIRKRALLLTPLADMMQTVAATARECLNCGNVGTADICDICENDKRANGELCVVEDVADLWAMERSGVFKGRYHVLGGTLSALDAIGPQELRIPRLIDRVDAEGISEVILALNATIDGQTTAHYIADQLEHRVRLTSLAQGVPIGGELDYLDDGTITAAMRARKAL
jgi:recombination protein RecR